MSITGAMCPTISCSYFEWKIFRYFSLSQKAGMSYRSPSFKYLGENWYLSLFPNGIRANSNVGYLVVTLCKESGQNSIDLQYTIGLKEADGSTYAAFDYMFTFSPISSSGASKRIIERSELYSDRCSIVPSDRLTIFCLIHDPKLSFDSSSQTEPPENSASYKPSSKVEYLHLIPDSPSYKPSSKVECLLTNMKELFLSEKNSDIIMRVKEQEFKVHKSILGARSPVFSAMFDHNMKENLSGFIDITDAEPVVFRDILLYMYCGETENMSLENVFEYYKTADKYSLKELKDECSEFMETNLSISNVCDILLLADVYNEINLKKVAKDFIIKNAAAILESDSWKSFCQENQSFSIQILEMIIKSGVSIKN